MEAQDLFRAGRLRDAIEAQTQAVREYPGDRERRLFLFELLLFSGDLDRARRQIDAIHYGDAALDLTVASYRQILDAEAARRRVFEEGAPPQLLGVPSDHLRLRQEALAALLAGDAPAAAGLVDRAAEATPTVAGELDGRAFQSLRDSDDLLAGVVEVMANGGYYWIGLDQIAILAMNPPRYPRDLAYFPARLQMASESGEVFLPVSYPGTYRDARDEVKLGRLTDWVDDGGLARGVGPRVYFVDDAEIGLLEIRELVLRVA